MKDALHTCRTHRRFATHGAAYAWVKVAGQRLSGEFRVWRCPVGGRHWHVGHTKRSIWATFQAIEAERQKAVRNHA